MPKTNAKRSRKIKPVRYRQRHKKLEHIGEADTKHDFKERLRVTGIQSHASEPVYFSVSNGQTDSTIEVDSENYRTAATTLDDNMRVRRSPRRSTPTTSANTRRSPEIDRSRIAGQESMRFPGYHNDDPLDDIESTRSFSYTHPVCDDGPQLYPTPAAHDFYHLAGAEIATHLVHAEYVGNKDVFIQSSDQQPIYQPSSHQEQDMMGNKVRMQSQDTGSYFSCLPAIIQMPSEEPEGVFLGQEIAFGGKPDPAYWNGDALTQSFYASNPFFCQANVAHPEPQYPFDSTPHDDNNTPLQYLTPSCGNCQNPCRFRVTG